MTPDNETKEETTAKVTAEVTADLRAKHAELKARRNEGFDAVHRAGQRADRKDQIKKRKV